MDTGGRMLYAFEIKANIIPFKCKMCDLVCLLFDVEDCSIIVFCHLCVLCDFIVNTLFDI